MINKEINKKSNNSSFKNNEYGIIQDMILFIKKWWLLENLRKEINRHSRFQSIEELSAGRKVLLSSQFFIANDPNKQHPQFPGLAYKTLHRFSYILWWRKKDNPEKLKKIIQEYNDIFSVCVEEGYVKMVEVEKDGEKMKMPSTSTSKAHKISGSFGLLEGLLLEYKSVWRGIFLPIITFILGIVWSSNLLILFKSIWGSIF